MDPQLGEPDEALAVTSRLDLIAYLNRLAVRTEQEPDGVENPTSAAMIEAAAAWLTDTRGKLPITGLDLAELSPWQMVAVVFSAGLIYE